METISDNDILYSLLSSRGNLDFTERFWNFLQTPTEKVDLIDAFTAVVEELETGRLVPFIHKENTTSFGSVIRNLIKLSRQQTASDLNDQKEAIGQVFDQWLETPMDVLVELGIWKLKRDYAFHFQSKHNTKYIFN